MAAAKLDPAVLGTLVKVLSFFLSFFFTKVYLNLINWQVVKMTLY